MKTPWALTSDPKRILKEPVARMDASVLRSPAMAAKKTPKKQSKSDFIRSLPATMSATEVVAKAKEAGIEIGSSLVYMVRGPAAGKKRATKVSPKKGTAKAATPKSTAPKKNSLSKADFVRQNPSFSANEIAAKAKTEGIKIDANYVYSVRAQAKKAAKVVSKTATPRTSTQKAPTTKSVATNGARPSSGTSSVEDLLRAVASEIGLGRALEILGAERARVRAVIGG